MALRDKLFERSKKFLEPGEQAQAVFMTQTGPSPYWLILTYFTLFFTGYRIVVVTDRAIVVSRSGFFSGTFPKKLVARLPRDYVFPTERGLWVKTQLGEEKVWRHRRFLPDVEAANNALAAMRGGPSAVPAPPQG